MTETGLKASKQLVLKKTITMIKSLYYPRARYHSDVIDYFCIQYVINEFYLTDYHPDVAQLEERLNRLRIYFVSLHPLNQQRK